MQGGPATTGNTPETDAHPPNPTPPAPEPPAQPERLLGALVRRRRSTPLPRPDSDEAADLTLAEAAPDSDGFRFTGGSYTPGVRSQLAAEDTGPSRFEEVAARLRRVAVRLLRQVVEWLRVYAPIVRDRAVELWRQRPRSWAETVELARRGRAEARRRWPTVRAWSIRHRVLIGGVVAVLVFASADGALGLIPSDAQVSPGVALRVPVQYPLQVQASPESSKRYLDAINNGEHLREQAVVSAAAAQTLERAKAEAAAAVAGQPQPWMTPSPDSSLPPGFVIPGVGGYALPAKGVFTSGFGPRWGTFHAGIDIAAPLGSPIYAVAAGTVIDAGPAQGFGLWVRIRHDDGTISVYGHMYDFSVSVGERVPAGLQIARIGNRGDSTGPHLHFEIIINGQHVDPQPWLAQHGIIVG
ncbi:M23 family metallopeptidase [Nocardia sp. CDC160]|uniref:M23 family metallopeptidase n=1 Tax=Nocardia sp. CDC160 TaxID=3112166 RepID=UPI002DB962C3|nr:M23 family metallopeptidase [Nocardia sp. CDC160]MEC3913611.1 M23 family metallopeptidase [Nocardia sp. CDC160]